MLVRQDIEHALDAARSARVDAADASLGNRGYDHASMHQVGNIDLGGVFRGTGDFGTTVDARGRTADIRSHARQLMLFIVCDCSLAVVVWDSSTTTERR